MLGDKAWVLKIVTLSCLENIFLNINFPEVVNC